MKTLKLSALVAALLVSGSVFANDKAADAKKAADAAAGDKKAEVKAPSLNELAKAASDAAKKVAEKADKGEKAADADVLAAHEAEVAFNKANATAGSWDKYSSKITRNKLTSGLIAVATAAVVYAGYKAYTCNTCEEAEAAEVA